MLLVKGVMQMFKQRISIRKIRVLVFVLIALAVCVCIRLNSIQGDQLSRSASPLLSPTFLSKLEDLDAERQPVAILQEPKVQACLKALLKDDYQQFLKQKNDIGLVEREGDELALSSDSTNIWFNLKTGKCVVALYNQQSDEYRLYGAEREQDIPSLMSVPFIGHRVYQQSDRSRIARVAAVTGSVAESKIRAVIPPSLRDLRLQKDVDEFLCYPFIQKQLLSVMGDDYYRFVKNSCSEGVEVSDGTQIKSDLNSIAESGAPFKDSNDSLNNEHLHGDEFSCTTFNGPLTVNTITYNQKTGKCMVLVETDGETHIYGAKPGEHWSTAIKDALQPYADDDIKKIKYEIPHKIASNPNAVNNSPGLNKQSDPFSFLYGTWIIYRVVDDQPASRSDWWFHARTARAKQLKMQIGKKVRFGPDKIVYDKNFLDLQDGGDKQASDNSRPSYSYHQACLLNGPETGHEAQATLEFSSTGAATGQGVGVTIDGTWYEFTNLGGLAVWDDRFFMFLKKIN